MKFVSKKGIAIILAAIMLSSLIVGCSDNTQPSDTSTSSVGNSTTGTTTPEATSNFNPVGLPIVNEKVSYNVVTYQAATSQMPVAEKAIFELLEQQTNVELILEEIPHSAWNEKMNLLISTGATPDAMIGGSIPDLPSAINAGLVVPIDDYMEYLPNLQRIYEQYPSAQGATKYLGDDKHYFYPSVAEKSHATCRAPLFINQTWLDNLGLEAPTTTEEFYDVLVAFRDGDPNQNGVADEIGFSSFDGHFGLMFKDMFGAWDMMGIKSPIETTAHDGVLSFNPITDDYRAAMEFFHTLYSEGLMEPETVTLSESSKNAKTNAETAIYGSAQEWNVGMFGGNQDQYVVIDPLIGPDGAQKYTINDGNPVSQALVVFEGCENPEVLFRYMDEANAGKNILVAHFGEEGVLYEVNEEDKTYRVKHTEYAAQGDSVESNRPTLGMQNFFHSIGASEYTEVFDPGYVVEKQVYSDQYEEYLFKNQYPTSTPMPVVDAEYNQIKLLEQELTVYLESFTTEFLMGGMDDEKWAEHIEQCEKLQYDKVLAYYQNMYDAAYSK